MLEIRSVIWDGVSGMLVSTSGSNASSSLARLFQPFSSWRSFGKSSLSLWVSGAGTACASTPCVLNIRAAARMQRGKALTEDEKLTDTFPGVVLLYLKTTILAVLLPEGPFMRVSTGLCTMRSPFGGTACDTRHKTG